MIPIGSTAGFDSPEAPDGDEAGTLEKRIDNAGS